MRLGEDEMDLERITWKDVGKYVITFTHRDSTEVYCNPDYHDTPFDRHRVRLKFEMTSILDSNKKSKESWNYRFNCFKWPETDATQVSFKAECDRLPEFNIAANKTIVLLPMENKTVDTDPERIDTLATVGQSYFQKLVPGKTVDEVPGTPARYRELYRYYPITTFSLLIYREPESMILLSSLPLLLLNLFTISVFGLSDGEYGDKLATLVTLILALFAFLPTLRSQIPMVPYTTLLEKQIFLSVGIQALALLEAVINSQLPAETDDPMQLRIKYGFLGLSVGVALFNIIFFLVYYLKRKRAFRNYINPGDNVIELDDSKDYKDEELAKIEEDNYKLREALQKKLQGADFKDENRKKWKNIGLSKYLEAPFCPIMQAPKTTTSTTTTSTAPIPGDTQVTSLDG